MIMINQNRDLGHDRQLIESIYADTFGRLNDRIYSLKVDGLVTIPIT
jgi:hypothetical protein